MATLSSYDAGYGPAATRILDVAEELVAKRGFHAVSYADIAAELGVTKPSVHYHFAGKSELGTALMLRYTARFCVALDALDRERDARAKLAGYAALYRDVLAQDRLCLCGMLAAEFRILPAPMQRAVLAFFAVNERWLDSVLASGRRDGSLAFAGSAREAARTLVAGLQGALLVARPYEDTVRFDAVASALLATVTESGGLTR